MKISQYLILATVDMRIKIIYGNSIEDSLKNEVMYVGIGVYFFLAISVCLLALNVQWFEQ